MPAPIPRPEKKARPVRIQPPQLPAALPEADLQARLLQADADDEPLEGCLLLGETAEDFYKTEVRCCRLQGCRLSGRLDRCYFRDAVFDTCDLSNADFSGCTFRRVVFQNCKMLGVKLPEARLEQVRFAGCHLRFANLSLCVLKSVGFEGCNLDGAVLQEMRLEGAFWKDCQLTGASLFRTPLDGQDLTSDEITGIQVSLPELKGAVVTPFQACELAGLLGLIVKSQ